MGPRSGTRRAAKVVASSGEWTCLVPASPSVFAPSVVTSRIRPSRVSWIAPVPFAREGLSAAPPGRE